MGRVSDAWAVLTGRKELIGSDDVRMGTLFSDFEGSRRGDAQLLAAMSNSPRLYTAAQRVAHSVAATPWAIYRQPRSRRARAPLTELRALRDKPAQQRALLQKMSDMGDLERMPNHPFAERMRKPNKSLRAYGTIQVTQLHLDLVGQTVWWLKDRDAADRPAKILPVPAHWVTRQGNSVQIRWADGRTFRDEPENVARLYHPDPADPYRHALGIGTSLNDELDVDENAAKTASARLRNRGLPAALVSVDGIGKEEGDALWASIKSKFRGPKKAGGLHMTSKKIDVKQLSEKLADLDLAKLREFEASVIWTTYGVSPEILGLTENINRATIQGSQTIFARYVMLPRLEFLRSYMQEELLPLWDDPEEVFWMYENPIPEDWDFMLEAAKAAPWAKTVDEWRAVWGDAPLPQEAGAVHMVPRKYLAVPAADLATMGQETDLAKGSYTEADDDARQRSVLIQPPPVRSAPLALPPPVPVFEKQDTTPQAEAVAAALRPERLVDSTRDLWSAQLLRWIRRELAAVGASVAFDILNPLIPRYLQAFAGERIRLINRTTKEGLRFALTEGVRLGEGPRELAKRVQGVFDEAIGYRSTLIARTEVMRASNWATTTAHRVSGVVQQREWIATPDERTRAEHIALDGQVRGINDPFLVDVGPFAGATADYPGGFGIAALDLQCFPGDHLVESPTGSQEMFRREYSGEFIRVTVEGGHQITGTPNHPVLTMRGWVALHELNESDHLIRGVVRDVAVPVGDDVDNRPATFEQAFDLASVIGSQSRSYSGSRQDFHGDGFESEVNVVALEGQLLHRLQSPRFEHLKHLRFPDPDADSGSLDRSSVSSSPLLGNGLASVCSVSGGSQSQAVSPTGSAHAHVHGFASTPNKGAAFNKAASDRGSGDPQTLCESFLADSGLVKSSNGSGVEGGVLRCHKVSSIERVNKSCKVYNIATNSGWYICNGFVVHNCRCISAAVVEQRGLHPRTKDQREDLWRTYIDDVQAWETQAIERFRAGFERQRADVLDALANTLLPASEPAA